MRATQRQCGGSALPLVLGSGAAAPAPTPATSAARFVAIGRLVPEQVLDRLELADLGSRRRRQVFGVTELVHRQRRAVGPRRTPFATIGPLRPTGTPAALFARL